jgi:phosphoribosylamine--glycine ligase
MRILVVGRGGREAALLWRLAGEGHTLFAAPGNAQSPLWATRWPDLGGSVAPDALRALCDRAVAERVDLVVVGPEAPLAAGLADLLRRRGVATVGPGREGARLESSKVFAKEFMARSGVPTARARAAETRQAARDAAGAWRGRLVVKAEGLRDGKGVIVTRGGTAGVSAVDRLWRDGERLVLEERLTGRELSVLVVTDGRRWWGLPPARDHKRRYAGDRGANTGGMGAVSPPPGAPSLAEIERQVLMPTLRGLERQGIPFRGVLYLGLMADGRGALAVLEYNVRFGDPECQAVLPRLEGELAPVLWAAASGEAGPPEGWLPCSADEAAAVVLVAPGYPELPRPGPIGGDLTAVAEDGTLLLAASVEGPVAGPWQGTGGRLLAAVGRGSGAAAAAMARLQRVRSPGASYRRDIGRV